ncbi:MAG TPA: hypothetical protein VKX17_08110 [Planctomycetota bacterium]|nr:hypothetical protein [Planctomycetota bacterium]
MSNHWPMLIAALLLGAAGWFGWQQQDRLQESVKQPPKAKLLPAHYNPNGPAIPVKSTQEKAPVTVPPVTKTTRAPESVPPPVMKVETPAAKPNLGANPAANPNAAQGADRNTVFVTLSAALQQRFNTAPMITNSGYAFVVDGARIDVDAQGWSLVIFNNTKAQPPEHTENFKAIASLVAAALEYDLTTVTPRQTPDQKTVWRPMSKLGKVIVEQDPAMFNSMTIKPLQKPPANFMQPQPNPNMNNGQNPNKPVVIQPALPKQPVPQTPPVVKQPAAPPMVQNPLVPNQPVVNPPVVNRPAVKQPPVKQPATPANPGQDQF